MHSFRARRLGLSGAFLTALTLLLPTWARADVKISAATETAKADLGTVSEDITLTTAPDSDHPNVVLQEYKLNKDTGKYVLVSPRDAGGAPVTFGVFPGAVNHLRFSYPSEVGHFGPSRLLLFDASSNFSKVVADINLPEVGLTVSTAQIRVTAPIVTFYPDKVQAPGADGKLHIPFTLKEPAKTTRGGWNGNHVIQIKGVSLVSSEYIFTQPGFDYSKFKPNTDPLDDYLRMDDEVVVAMPKTPGPYLLDAGDYSDTWDAPLRWYYHVLTIRAGGPEWVSQADPANYPDIKATLKRGTFPVVGGDFGNALASIGTAANTDRTFFGLLKADAKIKLLRENFDANRFLAEPLYQDFVDQFIQECWAAGIVPEVGPQDVPAGGISDLVKIHTLLATKYKGKPLMLCLLNEPHGYSTWAAWKADALTIVAAIRAIDPNMVLVVDAEGYSKDCRNVSADAAADLKSVLYTDPNIFIGWHPYIAPSDVVAFAGSGNLRLICEEYSPGAAQTPAMDAALQAVPGLQAVMAWAWTTPGQDSLNKVASITGSQLTLTADGQALAADYALWASGKPVVVAVTQVPDTTPTGTDTPTGTQTGAAGGASVGISAGEADTKIASAIADYDATQQSLRDALASALTMIGAQQDTIAALQADIAGLKTSVAAVKVDAAQAKVQAAQIAYLQAVCGVLTSKMAYLFVGVKLPAVPAVAQ